MKAIFSTIIFITVFSCNLFSQIKNFNPIIIDEQLKGYLLITKFNDNSRPDNFEATIYDEDLNIRSTITASTSEAIFNRYLEFFDDFFIFHFVSIKGKEYLAFKYDGKPITYPTAESVEVGETVAVRSNSQNLADNHMLSKAFSDGVILEQIKPNTTDNVYRIQTRNEKGILSQTKLEPINDQASSVPNPLNHVYRNNEDIYVFGRMNAAYNKNFALFNISPKASKQEIFRGLSPKEGWKDVTVLDKNSYMKKDELYFFYEYTHNNPKKQPLKFESVHVFLANSNYNNQSFDYFPQSIYGSKNPYEAYIIHRDFANENPNVVLLAFNGKNFGIIKNYINLSGNSEKNFDIIGLDQSVKIQDGSAEGVNSFTTKNIDGSYTFSLSKKDGRKINFYSITLKDGNIVNKFHTMKETSEDVQYYPSNNAFMSIEVTYDKKLKAYKFKRTQLINASR